MPKEIATLKNNSLANSDVFKALQDTTDILSGGGGTHRRISIKGSKFRIMVGGEQVKLISEPYLHAAIIHAAPIARTYYEGAYKADDAKPPTCWSNDTQKPSEDVPEEQKQSDKCATCPQNIKGSGNTPDGRACRFSQRLAVVIGKENDEGGIDLDMEHVYQLQLPATSIFGEAKDGKLPMQSYARFLKAHDTPPATIVTQMYFDEDAEVPKLFFKPVCPLDEDELEEVVRLRDHPDTERALSMTVSQIDGVQSEESGPEPEPEPEPEPKKQTRSKTSKAEEEGETRSKTRKNVIEEDEDEDDVGEPQKKSSKKGAAKNTEPATEESLEDMLAKWS